MVVLQGPPHQVAAAVPPGVHFTDEIEFGKDFKSAIDGNQPYSLILPVYPFVYRRRRQMLMTVNNGLDDGAPLRGNFIPTLPQRTFNLLLGINRYQPAK